MAELCSQEETVASAVCGREVRSLGGCVARGPRSPRGLCLGVRAAAEADLVAVVVFLVKGRHRAACAPDRTPPSALEPAAVRGLLIGAHHPLVDVAVQVEDAR